jgi:hypothetical protein
MSTHAIKNAVITRFNHARQFRSQHQIAGASIDTWFERTYRMYNNIHHPEEVAAELKRSGIDLRTAAYYPFGRLKVDAARVFVDGIYSHAVEAPFVLEPTRNPQLNKQQKGDVAIEVARLLSREIASGGVDYADVWNQSTKQPKTKTIERWLKEQADKMAGTYNDKAKEIAVEACEFRQGFMADQLDFGGWLDAWGIITHNLMAEPYTALCARESKSFITQKWQGSKVGRVVKTAPSFRAIDPRNLYLAPDSTSAQDGSGVTELTTRSRADLIAMLKLSDESVCKDSVLKAIVKLADADSINWLNLRLASTIGTLETHSLVHQGLFSGKELTAAGQTGLDSKEFYNATVEICHDELIRLEILPYEHNMRTYYTAQHTKSSSCYAGESILTKLYHVQNQINIATLVRDRNFYMSSGASYIIHAGYFNRPQDLNTMPYARNMAATDRSTTNGRGIEQVNTEAQYGSQDQHIEWLKRQGDEMCGVVSGLSGMARGGVTRTTLGGAVLDQTAGERMMNAAVLNLDRGMIEPMIKHLDADNMQWDEIPKHYMRGDVIVRGRGINGLREIELKGRLLTEALPLAMQGNQAGKVPDELLDGALKGYFDSKGINTSSMPSRASRREINAAGLNPKQTNDGRTYNQQQPMTGVA